MAALLSLPLLGPREWRPENLSVREEARSPLPSGVETWLLTPPPQPPGGAWGQGGGALSIPPGQVLLALLGLGGRRGADLRWSVCVTGVLISPTSPSLAPHPLWVPRRTGCLASLRAFEKGRREPFLNCLWKTFGLPPISPLQFSHRLGGKPQDKQRSSGFPHTRAVLLETGLPSGPGCSHNSWICGPRRVDWRAVLGPGASVWAGALLRRHIITRAHFLPAVLPLIASLEWVLQTRHNMRGADSRGLHACRPLAPPSTPGGEQTTGFQNLEAEEELNNRWVGGSGGLGCLK